jgi:hypothetical protein
VAGHVFISYHHDTAGAYVERLARFLIAYGVDVWFDRAIITGDRWARVIEHQINTCAAVIVIMNPGADGSRWVAREIDQAENRDRPVLPLLLHGDRFFRLADLQFEDVRGECMPSSAFVDRLRGMARASNIQPVHSRLSVRSRTTLHDAMLIVLQAAPEHRMRAADLVVEITRRDLYRMQDGRAVQPQQIHARVGHHWTLFIREGNFIKLRQPQPIPYQPEVSTGGSSGADTRRHVSTLTAISQQLDLGVILISPGGYAHLQDCSHKEDLDFSRWGKIVDSPDAWDRIGKGEAVECNAGANQRMLARQLCRDCARRIRGIA